LMSLLNNLFFSIFLIGQVPIAQWYYSLLYHMNMGSSPVLGGLVLENWGTFQREQCIHACDHHFNFNYCF
jgi:hypothetical protein